MEAPPIAGPLSTPHPPEICYGSRLHCWSCGTDEPDKPCFQACFECCHVYRTAQELLDEHNKVIRAMNASARERGECEFDGSPWKDIPETADVTEVTCCPLCVHDW